MLCFICIKKINDHCPDTGKTTVNKLEICRATEEAIYRECY